MRLPSPRVLLLTVALAACSDSSGPPDERPLAELHVIQIPDEAEPLETTVSFYARTDESRELRLLLQAPGGGQGPEFIRLRVPRGSLLARPDGSAFGEVDSILITMSIDPAQFLIDLQPSGLRFNPVEPALLRMHYDITGGDLNRDGEVNAEDDEIADILSIWRQEEPTDPFERLASVVTHGNREVRVRLNGFTRYALAY